jgi:hypothetical protein
MASKTLYRVEFTWNDDYRTRFAGIRSVSLVVNADNKFEALKNAWDIAKVLDETDPKSMSASRVDSE